MKNYFKVFVLMLLTFILLGCQDKVPETVTVGDWGPQETTVGKVVNPQANGKSAIWIKVSGLDYKKPGVYITFNNTKEEDVIINKDIATTYIPDGVINKAGSYVITIEEPSGRKTKVGNFTVKTP